MSKTIEIIVSSSLLFRVIEIYIHCWSWLSRGCVRYFLCLGSFSRTVPLRNGLCNSLGSGGNWLGKFRLSISLNISWKTEVEPVGAVRNWIQIWLQCPFSWPPLLVCQFLWPRTNKKDLIYNMYKRNNTSYLRVKKSFRFCIFSMTLKFWEVLARFFVRCPSFGVGLIFFLQISWALWFQGTKTTKVKCHFHHMLRVHTVHMT